ncbi:MAG TPA: dicarboxylate/amino acid:cation symporter [Candidatus Limnocylindria bacterium]|nr:dicarboxylate/amino acid:cation symporter [Candidatus Limnocylindria bacterium]
MNTPATLPAPRTPWYRILYVQVLIAVVAGVVVGHYAPEFAKKLKPLGDAFIKLIKLLIAPIIFCTVVHGVASMRDLKKLGRIGGKTLFYFEIVSTLALVIGLVVVNVLRPGDGFNVDPKTLDPRLSQAYVQGAQHATTTEFLLNIIPNTFVGAFVSGDLLQVLFVSLLTAFAISALGERGTPALHVIDRASEVFFGIMRIVVKAAPIGAFGAMAFTIGSYGINSLGKLAALMGSFYLTAALFVAIVLGGIAAWSGFSIFRFLIFIKEELFLVLGTSSSETALPGMIQKMRRLGCAPATVGLVIPTGYSFNLDGTNIYMAMAAVFLAQATNTPLDLPHQIGLLLVAMITSKGASAVTGAGFVALAATLVAVPGIPVESLALLIGIDRFMSECRAITNLIGNGVATVAISRWEGELSKETLRERLRKTADFQSS